MGKAWLWGHCPFSKGAYSPSCGSGTTADAQPYRTPAPPVPYICQPGQPGQARTIYPTVHLQLETVEPDGTCQPRT